MPSLTSVLSLPRRGPRRTGLSAALADRHRYERQIDALYQRHMFDGGLKSIAQGDVSLATAAMRRGEIARLLASTVGSGEYVFHPAMLRDIRVSGKRRRVFTYPLLDLIVHGVVGELLTDAMEPTLSDQLYSYRSGVSWSTAVFAFAAYVRQHRRARSDPRDRGLYVLRRDVESYTDSIPVGPGSPVWAMARGLIDGAFPGEPVTAADWAVIEEVIRPMVAGADGAAQRLDAGVPTGQPISVVLFNLYLRDLDGEFGGIPGAFYARYSDDLIFAHPDAAVVRDASERLDGRLTSLGLAFNAEKRRDLYLTGAGRASTEWREAHGTTNVPFLGTLVSMDGTVALGRRKVRALFREVRHRVHNAGRSLADAELDHRGRALAGLVNRMLRWKQDELQQASATLLASAITDRRQLRALDLDLARIVAETATGHQGPRAFRLAPYRTIRAEWRLASLVRARDRSRDKARRWTD